MKPVSRELIIFDTRRALRIRPPGADTQFSDTMIPSQPNNPLHGKTLEAILVQLVDHFGWNELGDRIRINCFLSNPSIKSSLTFLRKTPWARQKVEELYISTFAD